MKIVYIIIIISTIHYSNAQKTLPELLEKYNHNNIPYISVQESANTNAILLDAREPKEFQVSHLKNAVNVGYKSFDINTIKNKIKTKNSKIVVYCSLGIRSEIIANKLKKEGYTNVFNLYGGIFEWKNQGFPVYDLNEKETEKVHTFSKTWSKWLLKGTKVFD